VRWCTATSRKIEIVLDDGRVATVEGRVRRTPRF
jgi:hypothetical protein